MAESEQIKLINAHLQAGKRNEEKSEQHFIAAGLLLEELKDDVGNVAAWEKIIREKCNLGKSRAYELLQIAEGRSVRTPAVGKQSKEKTPEKSSVPERKKST